MLVALYAVIGFFAVPPLAKWQLEKRLSAELGRPVSVGQVRSNPFALSLALQRVMVRAPDGGDELVSWTRLYVNFDAIGSFAGEWVLDAVELEGFHSNVEVRPDGALNFSDLIERFRSRGEETPAQRSGRPWRVRRLNVAAARVDFTDRSQGELFQTTMGPVNFTVADFRTAGLRGAPGRFEAVSESGEKLTWVGRLTAVPLTSSGEVRIENLLLPKYAPYLAERLRANVESGRLTLSAAYEIDLTPDTRRLALNEGVLQLKELRLTEPSTRQPMIDVNTFEIAGASADGVASRAMLDAVRVGPGRVAVERAADGSLNLSKLWTASPRSAEAPARPFEVIVKEIALRDVAVDVRDLSGPRPVELEFERVNASLRNFTTTAGAAMPVELNLQTGQRGVVRVTGNITREPLLVDLELEAASVALPPFSGYVERFANARLVRGAATMRGQLRASMTPGSPADVTFSGETRLEDLSVAGGEDGEELVSIAELAMTDLKVATQPRRVFSVGEIKLGAPVGRAVLEPDGTSNFATLLPREGGTGEPAEGARESGEPGPPADVTITRIVINGGSFAFEDRSVQPAARFAVGQVAGTLRNFSSLRPEQGSIDLRAVVNGGAPITAIGRLNPLAAQPFADVRVDGRLVDLMPAAPYVAKYAGYELESGRLSVDVQARLAEERLDMQNRVTLDQFTLGEASGSAEAVNLPVKLGVALLKDPAGKIELDLPVQGSLADPQFRVGQVAGTVVKNLLAKAATSPFALLGSMFGGGGEELREQEFVPGETTLTEESVNRLGTVQRALAARPALRIEIEGGYDAEADAGTLKERKLDALLQQRLGGTGAAGDAGRADARRPLTEEARATAIRQVFRARFPTGVTWRAATEVSPRANTSAPSPSAPGSDRAAPPPAPVPSERSRAPENAEERGLIDRAWDLATFKGPRDWWTSRRERAEAEERARAAALAAERERVARAEAARREAEAARAAAVTAPVAAPAPELSVEEMSRFLLDSIALDPADLAALAEERAQSVRHRLIADGAVAAERVTLARQDSSAAAKLGAKAVLHLR
ncbi:MAG TPA: DUF748 domain-containing protein [Opitutus sp.]|nr:DUF748 domain-containing protein [Opitutus sp.]